MPWQKKQIGKLPPSGKWVPIGSIQHPRTKINWLVSIAEKPEQEDNDWVSYHVMATKPVAGKANFRMSWNTVEKRFASNTDSIAMKDQYNSLYSEFLEFAGLQPD